MEKYKEIERSIIKKYRKEIWSKFVKAIKDFDMIKDYLNLTNDFDIEELMEMLKWLLH